jgi:hypothetical protein
MKAFNTNLILFFLTLVGLALDYFFTSLLLVLGVFQAVVIVWLLVKKVLPNSRCSKLLKYYIYASVISTVVFCIMVYYLNVRPDLFQSAASTESTINLLMRLFLIPAVFHLMLHRSAIATQTTQ